ncbi:hypothetical protein B0H16DRAFT_950461 [Mycena metata]|uniref:Uncharacterized protein n=1 Tax=Mycena metata TaxID=1033252 RepID=A0AAD7NV24_9AGAR|nr:hypothetical protein B0H16DRAFT_950461 [Mycena metata]
MPSTIAYAATKGAIRSITLPMARDCARFGIRVVTLAPGPFVTPLTGQWVPKVQDGITRNGLLFPRRYGAPNEFASTVRWVLECPYVNGETIKLTGGGRLPARYFFPSASWWIRLYLHVLLDYEPPLCFPLGFLVE